MRGEMGIKRSVFYKTAPYSGGLLKKTKDGHSHLEKG